MRTTLVCLALLIACSSDGGGPSNPSPETFVVANKASGTITVYTTADTGNAAPLFTISGTNTTLDQPQGVAHDPTGVILVTSSNPARILVFGANSVGDVAPTQSISGSNTLLGQPVGLTLDHSSRLYVANGGSNNVLVFAAGATGNVAPTATIGGSNTALAGPFGVALDTRGRIYVTSVLGNSVTVYPAGANGNVSPIDTIAGSNTGLNAPVGIALDAGGRIYVANDGGSTAGSSVTVYAPGATGNVTPIAKIQGASTNLDRPWGIALDAAGRMYVSNTALTSHQYRITVYASNANGDVAPLSTLIGANTGLSEPSQLAF